MSPDDGPGSANRNTTSHAVATAILATAFWAQQQDNPWIGILGATGCALATLYFANYLAAVGRFVAWFGHSRPAQLGAAGLVLVLVLALAGPPLWRYLRVATGAAPAFAAGCPHPAELRILTSPDSLEPTKELARSYVRWDAEHHRQCPTVHVFVYAATTPAAAEALASGWRVRDTQNPLVELGPRPDIWLPDSTVDVRAVLDVAGRAQLKSPVRASRSIASSPMVVASRAVIPGLAAGDATWSRVVSSILDVRGGGLLAPDPETSTTGLLALSSYLRGTGAAQRVDLGEARLREQTIAASGALAGDDSVGLLCRLRAATDPANAGSAIVTSEQLWSRFVAGRPLSDRCAPAGSDRLAGASVVEPKDTPLLDHPLVEFTWSTDAQRTAVAAFHHWLGGVDGGAALKAVDLDPARYDCAILDDAVADNPCVTVDLDAMLRLYRQARQPGRVLLALDASGSMTERIGPAGATRFAVAAAAVTQALGRMGPQDQFGLWTFPGPLGSTYREVVGIAEGDPGQRDRVVAALGAARPAGGTPLYGVVVAGLAQAAAGTPTQPRALVVLTDGQDTSSGLTGASTLLAVGELNRTTGVRLFVLATGEASCAGASDLRALAQAGGGECVEAGPDQLARTMAQLFDNLWKGQ